MADLDDVRRIVRTLPETNAEGGFGVRCKDRYRGFAWTWNERIEPKKPRVPNPSVLAVRTADLDEKEALIASDPVKFFTEPHYAGFPAVLVRLSEIDVDELEELLIDAWRCMAPRSLVAQFGAGRTGTDGTNGSS